MAFFNITQPLNFIKTIFIIIGIWNTGDSYTFLQVLHFFLISGFFVVGLFIAMLINLASASRLEEVTEGLYMTLIMASIMIRFVNFIARRKQFMSFLVKLHSPLVKPRTQEEIALFQNSFNNFNWVRRIYIGICWGVTGGGCIFSIVSGHQKLPFPAWYPFDWKNVDMHFWMAIVYQTLAVTCSGTTNANFDLAHGYLFLQVSLYYRLISMRLQAIGHLRLKQGMFMPHETLSDLIECIQMHQFVTKLTQSVQDIWTIPSFVMMNVGGIVICFTAYRLTTLSLIEDTGLFLSSFFYMGAVIIEILLPCYYGDEITDASKLISTGVYFSNWTDMPKEYRKLIFCFMESLMQPKVVTAGGYFQVGMKAMGTILQSAYSLFALLINMEY